MTKVIKRDSSVVEFKKEKIENAILKAMKNGSGIVSEGVAKAISDQAEIEYSSKEYVTISLIETFVFNKLVAYGHEDTARSYEGYRAVQAFKKKTNTTDESIIGLVRGTNAEVMTENSNKNALIASTQRDLIAGEVSKDISRRHLIPAHIVQAHDEGIVHWHK